MKVSAASFCFPFLTLEQSARVWSTIGFKYLDIGTFMKVGAVPINSNLPIEDMIERPQQTADRLLRIADQEGIGYSDLFRQGKDFFDGAVNHPDEAVRRANMTWFNALIDVASRAGFPGITLLPGMIWPELGPERSFDLACRELSKLLAIASDKGLRLSVEAHIESVIEPFDLAVRMVEATPGLKLTLDYTHFVAKAVPAERVHALVPYAGHVHVRQGAPGRLQTTRSEGTIDYSDIVRRLHAVDYKGFLAIEYVWMEWQDCNKADVVSESILLRDQINPISRPAA